MSRYGSSPSWYIEYQSSKADPQDIVDLLLSIFPKGNAVATRKRTRRGTHSYYVTAYLHIGFCMELFDFIQEISHPVLPTIRPVHSFQACVKLVGFDATTCYRGFDYKELYKNNCFLKDRLLCDLQIYEDFQDIKERYPSNFVEWKPYRRQHGLIQTEISRMTPKIKRGSTSPDFFS